jgi:acyl-CoA synthetase (NDP forming)
LLSTAIGVLRRRRMERTAIIEISGGGKGLVSDTSAAGRVALPELTDAALDTLAGAIPDEIKATNPIDTGGSWADPDKAQVFPATLSAFASQPEVDVIVSRFTIPRTGELGPLRARITELEAAQAAHPDRLFPVLSRTSDQYCEEWEAVVRARRIPFLQGYGRGLRALGLMAEYSRALHGPAADPAERAHPARSLPASSPGRPEGRRVLDDVESKEILEAAGIPLADAAGGASEEGLEIALGAHRDAQFGPVVTLGPGGLVAEVLYARVLRVAPLVPGDAAAMLDEMPGQGLLDGAGGRPPVDRAAIQEALRRLSDLMLRRPDIARIEINPAVALSKGLMAAAARVEILEEQGRPSPSS